MKTSIAVAAGTLVVLAAAAAWSGGQKEAPRAPNVEFVPAGYRGLAIPLSASQVEFLKKGDRVDVFVTFDAQMDKGVKEKVTATILQDILVLAVKKPASPNEPGVAELILNMKEAEYAALSLHQGEINLAIRAQGDTKMEPLEMASFRKLFK